MTVLSSHIAQTQKQRMTALITPLEFQKSSGRICKTSHLSVTEHLLSTDTEPW